MTQSSPKSAGSVSAPSRGERVIFDRLASDAGGVQLSTPLAVHLLALLEPVLKSLHSKWQYLEVEVCEGNVERLREAGNAGSQLQAAFESAVQKARPGVRSFGKQVDLLAKDAGLGTCVVRVAVLDKAPKSPGRRVTGEEEQAEDSTQTVTESETDPAARLKVLANRLIPTMSKSDMAELEQILRDAQARKPKDLSDFADRVNLLLDVFSLRLKTEHTEAGRLTANPRGTLQITRPTGGNTAFTKATISLVSVDRVRVGNRFTSSQSRDR